MKILVIAKMIPMADRAAMYLRLFYMLQTLATRHDVVFHALELKFQNRHYGEGQVARYHAAMKQIGIECNLGTPRELEAFLQREPVDLVLFEHYAACWPIALNLVRAYRPKARIVIDSVDVNYRRVLTRAQQTGQREHYDEVRQTKRSELTAYRRSDMVIAISEDDRTILQSETAMPPLEVIGLINEMPAVPSRPDGARARLIFIGNFEWVANADAMLFFVREVLPEVRRRIPHVCLRIVGNSPTPEVRALHGDGIEVLGFVSDIHPLMLESDISIAPLRFGGGLKGKITEAMSYRLPVVTTAIGGVGFGLISGTNVLIAEDAAAFADAIVQLIVDAEMYRRISEGGREFVERNFSHDGLAPLVHDVFERTSRFPTRGGPRAAYLRLSGKFAGDAIESAGTWLRRRVFWPLEPVVTWLRRHVFWRFEPVETWLRRYVFWRFEPMETWLRRNVLWRFRK